MRRAVLLVRAAGSPAGDGVHNPHNLLGAYREWTRLENFATWHVFVAREELKKKASISSCSIIDFWSKKAPFFLFSNHSFAYANDSYLKCFLFSFF